MSRTRHTDKEKARILRDFEHTDQSAGAFCRQRGVSYQTLMNWRGRASANFPDREQPPAFLEFELGAPRQWPAPVGPHPSVRTRRSAPVGPLVELELGGGITLRIHPARPAQP